MRALLLLVFVVARHDDAFAGGVDMDRLAAVRRRAVCPAVVVLVESSDDAAVDRFGPVAVASREVLGGRHGVAVHRVGAQPARARPLLLNPSHPPESQRDCGNHQESEHGHDRNCPNWEGIFSRRGIGNSHGRVECRDDAYVAGADKSWRAVRAVGAPIAIVALAGAQSSDAGPSAAASLAGRLVEAEGARHGLARAVVRADVGAEGGRPEVRPAQLRRALAQLAPAVAAHAAPLERSDLDEGRGVDLPRRDGQLPLAQHAPQVRHLRPK
eukprot:scaffold153552_cov32-Prasinocladus_malaysianus.AAC.1